MRDLLNDLYRECSMKTVRTRNQAYSLSYAASLLGGVGIPTGRLRQAYMDLRAAFEK